MNKDENIKLNKYQKEIAKRLIEHLRDNNSEEISYTDLSAFIGHGSPRTLGNRIGLISEKCHQKKYPLISVKVVSKTTGKPSKGFWGLYKNLNLATEKELKTRKLKKDFLEKENIKVEKFTNWQALCDYLELDLT